MPKFAASTAYTVGNIIQPLTAPGFNAQYAFRCTTAGTSSTEPSWPGSNTNTVTTGGATFTNVSGQSTYGWGAAAGNLYCISPTGVGSTRFAAGDRAFLSSDHSESSTTNTSYSFTAAGYGVVQIISVNRAGSVPPTAADYLAGAAITLAGSGNLTLDCVTNLYWQGITITAGGTASGMFFASSGTKENYFKNCALVFTTSTTSAIFGNNANCKVTLDNTTVTFNAAGQRFNPSFGNMELVWINTPSAILGTVPTILFNPSSFAMFITCRGVDLSALTTTLGYGGAAYFSKYLFDSCRIASGVVRLGTSGYLTAADEVELVNCYDGTHFLAERHTPAGDLTTEFSTTLVGGAQDNVGLYSHKMISSVRSDDFTMPLEGFWMDLNWATIGSVRTATVEIIGSASLNNNDIWLVIEYQGTVSSSLASFVTSQPTNVLATPTAVPSSSATWNSPPSTPVTQHLQVTFTPQVVGRVRGQVRLGKPSTTVWINPQIAIT